VPTDELDLSWLPDDRDVPWAEFMELACRAQRFPTDAPGTKTAAEGFLLLLRANGLATISRTSAEPDGLYIRKVRGPRPRKPDNRVQFVADQHPDDPVIRRLTELERRVARIEANLRA
jgi:hypothetical protein